jgi:hypothetical protein
MILLINEFIIFTTTGIKRRMNTTIVIVYSNFKVAGSKPNVICTVTPK